MTCTKCGDGMWVDPEGNEKAGFVYCHIYKGWMPNNGSCYNDSSIKDGE